MWIVRQYQETGRFFRKKLLKLFLILCICFAGLCVLSGIWLASEEALLNDSSSKSPLVLKKKGLFVKAVSRSLPSCSTIFMQLGSLF